MLRKKPKLFTRRKFLGGSLLAAAGSFGYAHWIEPNRLQLTKKEITIAHLPDALAGLKIAQLSDLHFQPGQHDDLITRALNAVEKEAPDLVVLTGDYINHDRSVFPPLMEHLKNLSAKHGVYGVMGNHDGWGASPSFFRQGFEKAGLEFLVNQGTTLTINGEKLYVLGTDSAWSGKVDAPACYRGHHGEPVLALVHEPDVFDDLRKEYPISLQLSGHTHGGQCRVPFIGYAPVKVRYGQNYLYGNYQRDDAQLFVSQGVGTVGARLRFSSVPEVAFLTLKTA